MSKKVITLDSSQIATYLECALLRHYLYEENLRPASQDGVALNKGTVVHSLLELYYKFRMLDPIKNNLYHAQVAIDAIIKSEAIKNFNIEEGFQTFLVQRFMQYIAKYNSNDFRPFLRNGISSVELGFSKVLFEDANYLFIVEGRIDLLAYLDYGSEKILCFIDHKSQSRATELYQFKPQFLTYAWATGCEFGLINYFGLANTFNDSKDPKTFRRKLIKFPRWKVQQWEKIMLEIFFKIAFGDKSPNFNSCEGKYGYPCSFTSLCETETDEMRESIKLFNFKKVEKWHPY